jgi:hypothetical protein
MRPRRWIVVVALALGLATALHYGFGWEFCEARRCPHRYKHWSEEQIIRAAGLRRDPDALPGHYLFRHCRVPVLMGTKSDVDAYEEQGDTVARNADGTAGFKIEAAGAARRRCKREGSEALEKLH